jgi:hypothetical protein
MQQRIFDFLYPNAYDVKEASPFDLQIGQTLTNLEVRIPPLFGAPFGER